MTVTELAMELMTTKQVCELLHCHRNTVVNLINRGQLAPIRLTTRKNLFRADEVCRLIDGHTNDDAVTIRGALALMAESHAEEQRPLCPQCVKRRVNRGGSVCTWCEQNQEAQLLHKRNWWERTGSAARAEKRQTSDV